jgi:hypothetical protein
MSTPEQPATVTIERVQNGVIIRPYYGNNCVHSANETVVFSKQEEFAKWCAQFFPKERK